MASVLVDVTLRAAFAATYYIGKGAWCLAKRAIWGRQPSEAEVILQRLERLERKLEEETHALRNDDEANDVN